MKAKTNELTGAALDWAVAKCEGLRCGVITPADVLARRAQSLTEDEMAALRVPTESVLHLLDHDVHAGYSPSTDWSKAGPIIEQMGNEGLLLQSRPETGRWAAIVDKPNKFYHGPTPLIAAMRCYVASKLGEEVDVPAELLEVSQ